MTNSVKRNINSEGGEATQEALLAECIRSLGVDTFPKKLINAIKSITSFDNSVVFAYYKKEKPRCLFHTFTAKQRVIYVDDYLKGPYLLDPFFKACSRKMEAGLYRLRDIAPDRFYQSEYYRSYYVRTGLSEELAYIFYLPTDVAIVVSLMRLASNPKFSARQFRDLENHSAVVISLAEHHWQTIQPSFEIKEEPIEEQDSHTLIEQSVGDLFGARITPRETQVVAQVLEGHSSESIANSLGISVGTARIHRRNIYAKLQVSSQQELFAIFFKKIMTVHD